MRIEKNGIAITSLDEWFLHAPPAKREKHWKPESQRSQMARHWLTDEAETQLLALLKPVFGNVIVTAAEPERKVTLDQHRGPRNCDLVIQAECEQGHLTIHIEGKADEPFDRVIGPYVKKMMLNPTSRLPHRVELLSQTLFGHSIDERVNGLWYQLVQGTVAALADAVVNRSTACVFIVHEFHSYRLSPRRIQTNHAAWNDFLGMFPELADVDVRSEDMLLGPVTPARSGNPNIPIYFAKTRTVLQRDSPCE